MVTRHERSLDEAAVARRIREHADEVHARAGRVPFWEVDATGPELTMRDMDGDLLITFHGIHGPDMARWLDLLGQTAGLVLADLIYASAGTAARTSGHKLLLQLLQEMGLEPRPARYRPR
ncbi:hypothetical protein [Amycolatopsis panacis]|uniref:Uncharacterized protein n=1 Tax=Amycolatopsis panacis TaxID=2340917 RepID=A0A419IC11_9PSEU|nr:hypothetical protein [Amycolatopsis panacis]RJQ92391.1 hypothetical protein D5S19_01105 [Amycolatopsis panacis]